MHHGHHGRGSLHQHRANPPPLLPHYNTTTLLLFLLLLSLFQRLHPTGHLMAWTRVRVSPRLTLGRLAKSWSLGSRRCWLSGARHRARHRPTRRWTLSRIRLRGLHRLRLHLLPHPRLLLLRLQRPRLTCSTTGDVRRFGSHLAKRGGNSSMSLRRRWAGRGGRVNLNDAGLTSVGLCARRRSEVGTSGRRDPTRTGDADGTWLPCPPLPLPPRRRSPPLLQRRHAPHQWLPTPLLATTVSGSRQTTWPHTPTAGVAHASGVDTCIGTAHAPQSQSRMLQHRGRRETPRPATRTRLPRGGRRNLRQPLRLQLRRLLRSRRRTWSRWRRR